MHSWGPPQRQPGKETAGSGKDWEAPCRCVLLLSEISFDGLCGGLIRFSRFEKGSADVCVTRLDETGRKLLLASYHS